MTARPSDPRGDPISASAASATGVVGVVLAGGRSRRMGRDKARLEVGGEPLAAGAARRLAAHASPVVIADGGANKVPGRTSVPDGPGAGPLAGILGAATAFPGRDLLVLACDLPGVPAALLARLADPAPCDGRVPRWSGGLEPLCALYRPRILARLRELAQAGELSPTGILRDPDLVAGLEIRFLEEDELRVFGEAEEMFRNLNSPGDLG